MPDIEGNNVESLNYEIREKYILNDTSMYIFPECSTTRSLPSISFQVGDLLRKKYDDLTRSTNCQCKLGDIYNWLHFNVYPVFSFVATFLTINQLVKLFEKYDLDVVTCSIDPETCEIREKTTVI